MRRKRLPVHSREMERTMSADCSFEGCYREAVIHNLLAVLLGKHETNQQFVFRVWHACPEHILYYSRYTGDGLYQQERERPYFRMFFLLTSEHLALAKRLCIVWYGKENGGPGADIVRPYGNSAMLWDIAEITGCDQPGDGEAYSPTEERYLRGLHRDMHPVLQIILHTGQMKPGVYKKPRLTENWVSVERLEEEPELVLAVSGEDAPQPMLAEDVTICWKGWGGGQTS